MAQLNPIAPTAAKSASLDHLIRDETWRRREFPVTAHRIYMQHAGVCPLPRCASEAMIRYAEQGSIDNQELEWQEDRIHAARASAAALIGAKSQEIALLGPTAVGLSLVAGGLDWRAGDEVVYYADDYPANVYPWRDLERHGVRGVTLTPNAPGQISWDAIESALTPRTRLVSLASCHYLAGIRIDVDTIGRNLHERGILFCVDGIQTVGAFPMCVEHVDFLSADSHKWMLGPAAAGIFYVREALQERLRPVLLGSYNVVSPEFVAQPAIEYYPGARRYEPGMLNLPGITGMDASIRMLLELGVDAIAARLLRLSGALAERLQSRGFVLYGREAKWADDLAPSAILSARHPERDSASLHAYLAKENVSVSLRQNRAGESFIRFSPHFYNTEEEIDRVVQLLS